MQGITYTSKEFQGKRLQELVTGGTLPSIPYGYPDGWMATYDLTAIYNVARLAREAVLEIGPWLGRSTSAVCCGIKDSASNPPPKFDVVDFGITSPEEWARLFGLPFDPKMASGVAADAIHHPGGTNAVLVNNLKRNGLLQFTTTIIRGNFLDLPFNREYKCILCDTTHNEKEAALYLDKISTLVSPGAVLIFDDVVREDFANYICGHFKVQSVLMTALVAQYCKLLVIATS